MKETAAGLKDMTSAKSMGLDTLNKAADSFEKWDPAKSAKAPPKTGPAKPEGPNTAAMREEQAAKDVEGARAAFTPPSDPAPEPREHRPVRPPEGHRKNMPKKTAQKPQRRGR